MPIHYAIWQAASHACHLDRTVTRVNELRILRTNLHQRLAAGQAVQSHLADALVTG